MYAKNLRINLPYTEKQNIILIVLKVHLVFVACLATSEVNQQ